MHLLSLTELHIKKTKMNKSSIKKLEDLLMKHRTLLGQLKKSLMVPNIVADKIPNPKTRLLNILTDRKNFRANKPFPGEITENIDQCDDKYKLKVSDIIAFGTGKRSKSIHVLIDDDDYTNVFELDQKTARTDEFALLVLDAKEQDESDDPGAKHKDRVFYDQGSFGFQWIKVTPKFIQWVKDQCELIEAEILKNKTGKETLTNKTKTETQCIGPKRKGSMERCVHKAKGNSDYCGIHRSKK
jgi:hypothetical protein